MFISAAAAVVVVVAAAVTACGPVHQKAKQKYILVVVDRTCHSARRAAQRHAGDPFWSSTIGHQTQGRLSATVDARLPGTNLPHGVGPATSGSRRWLCL